MGATQKFQQLGLVLIGQAILGTLLVHTGPTQLFQQGIHGHFQFAGELGNTTCRHKDPPFTRTNERGP